MTPEQLPQPEQPQAPAPERQALAWSEVVSTAEQGVDASTSLERPLEQTTQQEQAPPASLPPVPVTTATGATQTVPAQTAPPAAPLYTTSTALAERVMQLKRRGNPSERDLYELASALKGLRKPVVTPAPDDLSLELAEAEAAEKR